MMIYGDVLSVEVILGWRNGPSRLRDDDDEEMVGGNGISWIICTSRSRQITTPAPQFYRSDALLDAQPTVSMHWTH